MNQDLFRTSATGPAIYLRSNWRLSPGVVAILAVLSDEWQAIQAWARLAPVAAQSSTENRAEAVEAIEKVVLTVEAVNPRGARKLFTSADYPEFTIPGAAAVEFFRQFTDSPSVSA